MDIFYRNLKTEKENRLLPFLKVQINDPFMPMDLTIRKSKNIINRETFKLVDEYKILKFKNNLRNSESKSSKSLKVFSEPNKVTKIILNNNIKTSANNSFFKGKMKDMKTKQSNNYKNKYKKIKNFKLSSGRERYIYLLKKYKFRDIIKSNKILDDSKTNNSFMTKQNKSNSILKTSESQINNSTSVSKTLKTNQNKTTKKDFNKSISNFFNLAKTLRDTQRNSMNMIKRIKRYKIFLDRESENITDIFQKREDPIKRIDNLIDGENTEKNRITQIDYNKILGPLHKMNDTNLRKIKINKKSNGQIWLKQSTANLIKFGQYYNRMDDELFFKQRKKIIKKLAAIEKDSEIVDGIKTERTKYDFGKGIKKNCQIIKQLAENNYDIFKSVSKKLDNINI